MMTRKDRKVEKNMILSDNIRELIDGSSKGDTYVAKAIEVTPAQLYRYKFGLSDVPALVIHDIAKLFDVDVRRMFLTDKEWLDYKK